MHLYSFNLADFEEGQFTATRFPESCAVSGDWVCLASSDEEALRLAQEAAHEEWAAPDTRDPRAFTVKFHDSHRLQSTAGE